MKVGTRKVSRVTGLPDCENCGHFDALPACDRQTDRQTAYGYCAL